MGCHQELLLFYTPSSPGGLGLSLPVGRKASLCVSNSGVQSTSHTEWVGCSSQPGQEFEDLGPHVCPDADVGLVSWSPWHMDPRFLCPQGWRWAVKEREAGRSFPMALQL